MEISSRKKALRYFFARVVDTLGYKFTPDDEIADYLLEQEVELEQKFGSPYCPCQGRTQRHEDNLKLVCPCIPFHREHFDFMKRCWCGLYVHKDITNPDRLRQVPYSEFRRLKDADRSS